MMQRKDFLQGMAAGLTGTLVGGVAIVYALARANLLELKDTAVISPGDWLDWAYSNLGSSIPVFAVRLSWVVLCDQVRVDSRRLHTHVAPTTRGHQFRPYGSRQYRCGQRECRRLLAEPVPRPDRGRCAAPPRRDRGSSRWRASGILTQWQAGRLWDRGGLHIATPRSRFRPGASGDPPALTATWGWNAAS